MDPTTVTGTTVDLPSKQDRLVLYYQIERVVHSKIRALQYLPDTRPTDRRGRVLREYPEPSTVGLRGRQIYYLKMELLPTVSASLLLPLADLHTPLDQSHIVDPIGCVSLLISNIILLSKGNYDARIRSVIKTACVQVLERLYQDEPLPELSPARALYIITKEQAKREVKDVQKEDEELEENVNNSATILPSTPTQVAKERFETLEKTIAMDILRVLLAKEAQEVSKSHPSGWWSAVYLL